MKCSRSWLIVLAVLGCHKKTEITSPSAEAPSPRKIDATLAVVTVPACKVDPDLRTIGPYRKNCIQPCPDNSPIVNTFPINGLAIDGAGGCSPEGVQVLPASLTGPKCGTGTFNLTAENGKLVGRNTSATCEGTDLEGSVFAVQGTNGTKVSFKIVKVQTIQLDDKGTGPDGYLIERELVPPSNPSAPTPGKSATSGDPNSMCNLDAANGVRRDLGIPQQPSYEIAGLGSAGPNDDLVIVVPDPLYTNDVVELDNSHKFFNLACAEDALAKRSLERLFVASTDAESEGRDLAALRMMTATYCERPYTIRGMKFHYKSHQHSAGMKSEALWIRDRVSCIQSPRLAQKTKLDPSTLKDVLRPEGCKSGQKKCDWTQWADAVRKECKRGEAPAVCKPGDYDFESFVPNEELGSTIEYKRRGNGGGSGPGSSSGTATPK